ncbi:MAG: hypothetical protein ACTSU5_18715 [Promethearchaeota archaeon]
MKACPDCGGENDDGAVLCVHCGAILQAVTSSAGSTGGTGSSGGTGNTGSGTSPGTAGDTGGETATSLVVVRDGTLSDEEIELVGEDFELLLGRYDLDAGIVPDVDLTKFVEPVVGVDGQRAYTVSRKHALLVRKFDLLSITRLGNSRVLVRPRGSSDWEELKVNEARDLEVGDRVFFGNSDSNIVFEVV